MSDSNDPKHVPLVFDDDLDGPVTNNAELNRKIEEQERREPRKSRARRDVKPINRRGVQPITIKPIDK